MPISQVLSSAPQTMTYPSLRAAMETAVTGYLKMRKAQWAAVNKCPQAGCNGASPPAQLTHLIIDSHTLLRHYLHTLAHTLLTRT